ncbi:alpha-glucosidase [Hortaea werneckii]|nr:alpha-glucosidase [Hortaea werneckii]
MIDSSTISSWWTQLSLTTTTTLTSKVSSKTSSSSVITELFTRVLSGRALQSSQIGSTQARRITGTANLVLSSMQTPAPWATPRVHHRFVLALHARSLASLKTSNQCARLSALTLGEFDESNAVSMSADNYPVWSVTVDMPADGDSTYQFLRAEPDGSYIYEDTNRTISTGDCGSTDETDVQSITTSSPDGSSKLKRSASSIPPQGAELAKRQSSGDQKGLPDRDLINPPYMIDNAAGSLSNKTIDTSLTHYGGWKEYDTHNLYGAMMSEASRIAMLSRRPSLRPLVITRSTFAGSGRQVGHWLGDNISDWFHYLVSISQMLDFGALFQVPMVGSDVCGFGGNTNELLCARWATLGAFYPFYRNHNELGSLPQEFYRWPLVAEAARNAINIRYQLLDYFYTSFYEQTTRIPSLLVSYQFFWGPGIMVAPVTEENSTSTTIYMPDDIFYDFYTHEAVRGQGEEVTLTDIDYTTIPLYYKGGSIVAMRSNSSNTTTELRKEDFTIVIAPGLDGTAKGSLYLDDGVSLEQGATSYIRFHYSANGEFRMEGTFDYESGNSITSVMVLDSGDNGDGKAPEVDADPAHGTKEVPCLIGACFRTVTRRDKLGLDCMHARCRVISVSLPVCLLVSRTCSFEPSSLKERKERESQKARGRENEAIAASSLAYHPVLCLTRPLPPATGFLMTIHSIIEVANDSENQRTLWTVIERRHTIPQVNLRRTSNRYTPRGPVVRLQQIRLHRLLDPNRLRARVLCHLVDVREVPSILLRLVGGREHVLLPRLAEQTFDDDLAASADEDGRVAGVAVSVVAVVQTRPDEHFLVMSEFPPRVYPSVIEVLDRGRVDLRRER